ncbi:MAG: hypothetical protein AAF362_16965 [Pseudomonadota bacterium]
MTRVLLSALGYASIVFPLAVIWHLVLFKDSYMAFRYFDSEPNVLLGFITILIQGLVLAWLYPRYDPDHPGTGRAFRFAAIMGLFLWTCHVLAFVAKQNVPFAMGYIAIETGYLIIQFSLFAVLLRLIYRGDDSNISKP